MVPEKRELPFFPVHAMRRRPEILEKYQFGFSTFHIGEFQNFFQIKFPNFVAYSMKKSFLKFFFIFKAS